MDKENVVKVTSITRGALNLLSTTMAMQQWYSDTRTAFIAGRLLVEKVSEIPEIRTKRPIVNDEEGNDALREYLMQRFDLELTSDELAVCTQCLEFFISKGALNINAYLLELMTFLDMKT